MDALCLFWRTIFQPILQVLVDVFREERRNWTDKLSGGQQNFEKNVQREELVFLLGVITLHAGSVKAHVPVGKVFEETENMPQNSVKMVVVHLIAHLLDHALTCCNNPAVHDIGVLVLEHLFLEFWIINEVFADAFFPSCNVLNAESV